MKLSKRLDIVVLVLIILYVLTGCTITTNPGLDLSPCIQWTDIQVTDKECTRPLYGGERLCVYEPYITSVCVARESST